MISGSRPIDFPMLRILLSLVLAMPLWAAAQSYPAKPVRIVVAFVPGGGDDFHGRLVAQKLTEMLGANVLVENRSGAGGFVGWESVAKSQPDGYTLLLGGGSMTTIPSLRPGASIDVLRDFTPVSLISTFGLVLVVHPSVPARTVKDVIALARAQPGKLNYASSGAGATPHLSAELFKTLAKVDVVHIPYKGSTPAYIDLMSGQIDMYFGVLAGALPHIRSGKVRAVGVTAAKRAASLPQVPTIAESGLPGYELTSWYAILGPGGMPREVVSRLNAAIVKAVALPDMRERLLNAGSEPQSSTPEELAARMRSDVEKFGRIIRTANIKAE
jgi:tripartite-type tricarboxylate transporter receptor subunit TctC